jgi:hypothetical protein
MASGDGKLGQAPLAAKANPVLCHSVVTCDADALKFNAAASLQLQLGDTDQDAVESDHRLITSPYNDPLHLLDLHRLDVPSQLLAKALTVFKPIRSDYATLAYTESFNWQRVVDVLRELSAIEGYEWEEREFYVVVFRSRLLPTADISYLYTLDFNSHAEATESPGLLKYWFGNIDEKSQNLATCTLLGAFFFHIIMDKLLMSTVVANTWQVYGGAEKMQDVVVTGRGTSEQEPQQTAFTPPSNSPL